MDDPVVTRTDPSRAVTTGTARFIAGTILAGRYRIVTLVGRGGMGEVYKAEDLKLGQPVALKFLPYELGSDGSALARFHREARMARQVSHPCVCRVYDVGEVEGLHFLTMEFIDGEDLASLLRRIGRLSPDKAAEIARQVCAGLAATHDAGVVHRDLKPANLMIDSRGRARLTDFGIAALARETTSEGGLSGTPAYMAPELLEGHRNTTRSDIYALGHVLHEIFTGTRPADRSSRTATLAPDLDPAVQRVILRCLDRDPERRPASPVAVAAALPGADPLGAALAAGETPSPEMVAAAGTQDTVRIATGATLVVLIMSMLMGGAWLRTQVNIAARVNLENSPDVLAHKAREALAALGYTERAGDTAYGFSYNGPAIAFAASHGDRATRWQRLESDRQAALRFWYRVSPSPMSVVMRHVTGRPPRVEPVTADNPPLDLPGMKLVVLDLTGRLVQFRAVLPPSGPGPSNAPAIDTDRIFAATGLDAGEFAAAEPTWTPPVAMDMRAAWIGSDPANQGAPVRLEVGRLRGVVTAVEVSGASQPRDDAQVSQPRSVRTGAAVGVLLVGLMLAAGTVGWANLRSGRGDRRGAWRIALLLFGLRLVSWALNTDHVPGNEEITLLQLGLNDAVFDGAVAYVMYLALEPFIRRRWPQVLVGWNRLLAGRVKDPLVGHETLVGLALASGASALNLALIYRWTGATTTTDLNALLNLRRVAAFLFAQINDAAFIAITIAFLAALLREVLRREWLVMAAVVAIFAALSRNVETFTGLWWTGVVMGSTLGVAAIVAIFRFGLVSLAVFFFAWTFLQEAPALLRPSAWYSGVSLFVFSTIVAMSVWSLAIATRAGR
jgi:serine/threonine-protein kinase